MGCPVCPAAGWVGGWIGGYLGIQPPQHRVDRIFSAVLTANLINISLIALKSLFDVSLCLGGGFTLKNIVRVGIKAFSLGIIYSIGVNYLLNRFLFLPEVNQKNNEPLIQPQPTLENNHQGCCRGCHGIEEERIKEHKS
jgi:hypothetical protein